MNETAQFHISFFFLKGKACAGFLILRQLHGCYMQKYHNCISIIDILNPCQICDQCFQVRSFYFFYHQYIINVNSTSYSNIVLVCVCQRDRERARDKPCSTVSTAAFGTKSPTIRLLSAVVSSRTTRSRLWLWRACRIPFTLHQC